MAKADKPEPYKNDDEEDNIRIFWSRNSHMVRFDDTREKKKLVLQQFRSTLGPQVNYLS